MEECVNETSNSFVCDLLHLSQCWNRSEKWSDKFGSSRGGIYAVCDCGCRSVFTHQKYFEVKGDFMNTNRNSSIDPNTGNVSWKGPLSHQAGNHNHMPSRTEAYLPGDEKGHVNASALGGTNTVDNVVAQHQDVNHGAYYSMEQGEISALQNGAAIDSTKTAVVDARPGDRPDMFLVSDHVTYSDGHTQSIHHSFTNASYAEQQAWNDQSAALPGTFDAPNPGDGLVNSMSSAEYAELMENTDAELPGIAEDYAEADFSGAPDVDAATADSDSGADCDTEE